MQTQTAEIDGWRVNFHERDDATLRYGATATDHVWGRYAEAYGLDRHDALRRLAERTGMDLEELLATFGL